MYGPVRLARDLGLAGLALGCIVALSLATAATAFAADPAPNAVKPVPPSKVVLHALPADGGGWTLQAQVSDAAGKPVANAGVEFTVSEPFLGKLRAVSLGTATTDTSGAASLAYVPTWNGHQDIAAVLVAAAAGASAGSGQAAGGGANVVSGPVRLDVTDASPVLPPDPPALGALRAIGTPAMVLLAVVVWLLLAVTFLYAVLGIARPAARASARSPKPHAIAAGAGVRTEG